MKPSLNFAKNIARAVTTIVVCAMTVSLTACGVDSDAEIIREGLTEELESIKNLDQEILDEMADSVLVDFEDYGITLEEFCAAWLDGFDYNIDNVVTEDDSGTATVTISCRPLYDAMYSWYEVFYDSYIDELEEDELYAYIGSSLIEAINNTEIVTATVELPYTLVGDTWYEGDGFTEAISVVLYGEE